MLKLENQCLQLLIYVKPYWNLNSVDVIFDFKELAIYVKPYWNLKGAEEADDQKLVTIDVKPYWNLKSTKLSFIKNTSSH